jgi:hypothetical protein
MAAGYVNKSSDSSENAVLFRRERAVKKQRESRGPCFSADAVTPRGAGGDEVLPTNRPLPPPSRSLALLVSFAASVEMVCLERRNDYRQRGNR